MDCHGRTPLIYAVDGESCCHTLSAFTLDGMRSGTSLAPVAFVQNVIYLKIE